MAHFDNATIERWRGSAGGWIRDNLHGKGLRDITSGADAWTIAHRCGITNEAYKDRNVVDAHIKTALVRIFPNAVFRDKYVY